MTFDEAREIKRIGLKSIEDKRKLKEFALKNNISEHDVVRVVHAKTWDEVTRYITE